MVTRLIPVFGISRRLGVQFASGSILFAKYSRKGCGFESHHCSFFSWCLEGAYGDGRQSLPRLEDCVLCPIFLYVRQLQTSSFVPVIIFSASFPNRLCVFHALF